MKAFDELLYIFYVPSTVSILISLGVKAIFIIFNKRNNSESTAVF